MIIALALAGRVEAKEVPPELGGPGFEKIAAQLGFETYDFNSESARFLGDPRAKKGGTFTHIVSRFPNTFRPIGQHSNYTENSLIGGLVFESLLSLHPVTLEWVPALATHWKISEDKMTFTYRIDPRARWADGKPVTAHDVLATFRLNIDEGILEPANILVYEKFEEPEVLSKYLVRVRAKTLNWRNFLYFSGMLILPARHIGNLTGSEFLKTYQFSLPPGSGPYALYEKDIKKQQSYALTRRPDYWGKDLPQNRYLFNFDKIRFDVVKENERLAFEKFKKGEQDLYVVTRAQWWVEETDFESVKKGWVQKRKIYNDLPAGTSGVVFNMRKPPFDDIRVRKAFAHLFPREIMIKKMFFNEYLLQHSNYAGSEYENPDNPKYFYDPERAVQLLAEAGWKERNAEGWLVKDGKPFVVEFGIPQVLERIYTPFQQELKKVGIDLRLKFQDGNTLFKMAMERNFLLFHANWSGLIFPNPETSYHSRLADQNNNNNLSGFKDPRVDRLLAEYDKAFDHEERVRIIREIDKIIQETKPMILWWYAPFRRILYWNKFGHPDYYFPRTSDYDTAVLAYWWYDPDKAAALEEAMRTGKSLPVGEVEVRYWPEYNARMEAKRKAREAAKEAASRKPASPISE